MRGAIWIHAAVAALILAGLDRIWPVWPVHVLTGSALVVVIAMAWLAMVASTRRRR